MTLARRVSTWTFVCAALAWTIPASAGDAPISTREYDDCDADFIAYLGSDAYQFSPRLPGDLGRVRLFTVLSFERAAAFGEAGTAAWTLSLRGPVSGADAGPAVRTVKGTARLEGSGQATAEFYWDGRDDAGRPVLGGKYQYSFEALFLADRLAGALQGLKDPVDHPETVKAKASVEEVIVNYDLAEGPAREIRRSAALAACQIQQNAPIESGLGFNYYYGSTHSHSNWSDGGYPTTSCSSGNAYGTGTFDPTAVFDYAKNVAGLDFWVVNEHNHLMQDAIANNDPPVTEAKVRNRYAAGRAAADAASVDDAFVGLYGMEWGVSTNSDQGHVTLLETPVLFGWETCSTCNGPNAECTPGSNCYFDVFTPKRFGYLTLYQRSVENPSPQGALGIFCHPGSGNFDNFAFNADADDAIQGIAVRSGLAFNTSISCGDANVATTDYSSRWKTALNLGFHLGPVADHDVHCNNYGAGLPNRTVYLLPNGATPVLTKPALLAAHKARHFFATEDSNAQLVFATGDGAHILGDQFTAAGGVTLRAALYDPDGESVSTLELWRGQIGGGVPAAAYRTFSGAASFSVTETLTSGSYYYYTRAVQADGHDVWSSPMWITYGPGGCSDATAPTVSIVAPANGTTITCADTTIEVTASDAGGIAGVDVRIDGGTWTAATFDAGSGRWRLPWASATATSGAHTIEARATDASCGANVGTAPTSTVTVNNASCGLDISGWRVVQANSAITYTVPAGTKIPDNGYVVIGRSATKAQFEAFWGALPAGVVYLNSAGAFPQINGSERYTLRNAANTTIDGQSVAMGSSAGTALQRKDPCLAAGTAGSWTTVTASSATPGRGAAAGCAKGMVINEFADALGTGNFVYEFVELHYDR
jgi:hypothetical protein